MIKANDQPIQSTQGTKGGHISNSLKYILFKYRLHISLRRMNAASLWIFRLHQLDCLGTDSTTLQRVHRPSKQNLRLTFKN